MWQACLLLLLLGKLQFVARASTVDTPEGPCVPRLVTAALVDDLNLLYECPKASSLQLVPYLWKPINIKIKCSNSRYSVYTATEEEQLKNKVQDKEKTFCGLDLLWDGSACSFRVSPFERTLIGIKNARGCSVTSSEPLNFYMLASAALGVGLFYSAGFLSSSFVFRMSCGTALFTTTSLALLLILLFRLVPHKKAMAAAMTAAGSSGMAIVRWVTGQWLPSWRQLVMHPLFSVYMGVSAIVGGVITYLYDDTNNPKVNTVIKVVLHGVGLLFVYFATWTCWPVAATVMGIMVASVLGPGMARGVQQTSARVQEAVQATHKFISTPFTARRRRDALANTPHPPSSAPRFHLQPTPTPTPRTAQQQPTPALPTPAPSIFDQAEEDYSLVARDYSGHRAIHPKATPPAPWEVQRKRRVKTFEEQMTTALVQQGQARMGTRATTSGQRSGTWVGGEVEEGSQDTGLSQVVRQGHILNPNSGRLIKIGGDVYNTLLTNGYTPDVAAGVLVAPGSSSTGQASGRQSASRSRAVARLK